MAITRGIGRFHYSGRLGTFSTPLAIEVDNAPSGTVDLVVSNSGQEPFFARLNDGTLTTPWARVSKDKEASLLLATSTRTDLEIARQKLQNPRWISAKDTSSTVPTTPFSGEIVFPAVGGSASVTPICCSTTTSDIEITDPTKGLILTSPNLKRWRIGIVNTGALSSTVLP